MGFPSKHFHAPTAVLDYLVPEDCTGDEISLPALSNRCKSTLLSHVFYGMGKRSGDEGWGYLEQSPSTACLAGPLVTPQ